MSTVSTASARPSLDMNTADHTHANDPAGYRLTRRVYREGNRGRSVFVAFFLLLATATFVFAGRVQEDPCGHGSSSRAFWAHWRFGRWLGAT